ncbi:SNARE-associated protein Snapin [Acrasis kona]|uniref:Biogenesis of lysosome-related organelles complex 1 subunit 7 n=1 Tax=Acrasis kona TaxID=1008807 RepID=A0AAW2ZES9_9EUKA
MTTEQPEKSLTTGLLHIFEPFAGEYEKRIHDVQLAQADLADRIEAMSKVLTSCLTEAEFVDVSAYLKKLVESRKKIVAVASTLNNINDRLGRLNKMAQNKYPEMVKLRQVRQEKLKQGNNTDVNEVKPVVEEKNAVTEVVKDESKPDPNEEVGVTEVEKNINDAPETNVEEQKPIEEETKQEE